MGVELEEQVKPIYEKHNIPLTQNLSLLTESINSTSVIESKILINQKTSSMSASVSSAEAKWNLTTRRRYQLMK
ncbi:hypothetical protein [Helicobacter himalayensis]|uniref:hypothetical protein n=1 Tax=Helicobacter himalayensis TaxID=1591088 RepID=UPI000AB21B27|nr:hypothetical protein [Helicobacter himalayensis]